MSSTAISVRGVGKRYRIGRVERYSTLRDSLVSAAKAPLRRFRRNAKSEDSERTIWAVRDVSFDVTQGEVVGIIGRNGAGKSTLLKLLSRITDPTEGYIDVSGRVGTLLEVGTGFHPELTGRENIFLNGVILGMPRSEIRRQFDAIIAFAEVDQFVDTPVKRYSSGMYMRLAFGVAAHLQPEILIVDEVLAVGDAKFQEKCLGKMRDLGKSGRTVLFVSHNMGAVLQLCTRGIMLQKGRVVAEGDIRSVVERYAAGGKAQGGKQPVGPEQHLYGAEKLQLLEVNLLNGIPEEFAVRWREPIELEFVYEAHGDVADVVLGMGLRTNMGLLTIDTHMRDRGGQPHTFVNGINRVRVVLQNPLRAGSYVISIGGETSMGKLAVTQVPDAARISVLDVGLDAEPYPSHLGGLVNCSATWDIVHGN